MNIDISVFIIIFGIIFIFLLLVLLILCYIKYKGVKNLYEQDKSIWLFTKNKFSLIESHFREYKEGKNPFTVLRDIGEVIYAGILPTKINKDNNAKE